MVVNAEYSELSDIYFLLIIDKNYLEECSESQILALWLEIGDWDVCAN